MAWAGRAPARANGIVDSEDAYVIAVSGCQLGALNNFKRRKPLNSFGKAGTN